MDSVLQAELTRLAVLTSVLVAVKLVFLAFSLFHAISSYYMQRRASAVLESLAEKLSTPDKAEETKH